MLGHVVDAAGGDGGLQASPAEPTTSSTDVAGRKQLVRQRPPTEGPTVTEVASTRRREQPAVEAVPPAPAGWKRFLIRNKYGVDRDFAVVDEQREQVLYVASGFWLGSIGRVRQGDRTGTTLYRLNGHLLNLPRTMEVRDPSGGHVARVRAAWRHPADSPITIRLASGTQWRTVGSLSDRQYAVIADEQSIVEVDRKSVQIRDSYTVDVADGTDPALAIALVWAIEDVLDDTPRGAAE
jgi:uncharacterized protein YxjI